MLLLGEIAICLLIRTAMWFRWQVFHLLCRLVVRYEPQHLMRRIVGLPYVSTNLQNAQHTGLRVNALPGKHK